MAEETNLATEDKSAEELAFDELSVVVREKDASGLSFGKYIERLEELADAAARKLEVARAHADTCSATKLRKPRCDIGKPRKRKRSPAAQASPAGSTGAADADDTGPEA